MLLVHPCAVTTAMWLCYAVYVLAVKNGHFFLKVEWDKPLWSCCGPFTLKNLGPNILLEWTVTHRFTYFSYKHHC